MRIHKVYIVVLLTVFLAGVSGCGDSSGKKGIVLSGTLSFPDSVADSDAPVLVSVTSSIDADILENNPREAIIEYVVADKANASFRVDLSGKGLIPGDIVYLIAFVDNNYTNDVPFPDQGDFIGVYYEVGKITPAVVLHEGLNEGFHIDINREVFDYEASISGSILGSDTGEVTLVAYAGDIESSDFTAIDFNDVMGFRTITKGSGSQAYTLNILPYGKDVPIENLQIFALLDANGSGTVDGGDKIGFYAKSEEEFSSLLIITGGEVAGIDIEFKFDVNAPSASPVSISGDFSLPVAYSPGASPVYIAVFDGSDPDAVLADPFSAILYFSRISAPDTVFSFDLTNTGLEPGDRVMLIGLWDKDFVGGFPGFTPGDFIGTYFEAGKITPAVVLHEGLNEGFHIDINREVFDYEASISGTILGDDAGEVTLVAYAGDIVSSDFTALDFNEVMGFKTIPKGAGPQAYTLDILPYGKDVPIENLQVFALLDANQSGSVDGGDRIGFYAKSEEEFSSLLTLTGGEVAGIDIEFKFDVNAPSASPVSISGDFSLPVAYTPGSAPVYIAVFDGSDPDAVLDDPFGSILYFSRIPAPETNFSFDLTDTGLAPGDRVMLIGLWDKDFVGGFPGFTPGDFIGIYFEAGKITPAVVLHEGLNEGFHIDINREVFDYEASISGTILGNDAGEVTLVAYAGDIVSSDFTALDFNEVMGFKTIPKGAGPQAYTLDILPYGKDLPIENLQIFALLDANGSGSVDGGDRIGFYGKGEAFSSLILITGGEVSGIDIEFKLDVQSASGIDMSIAGMFSVSSDYFYGDKPMYILVFSADAPQDIIEDPYAGLKYFYRMPLADFYFDCDLSHTDLVPGESVIIAGLWDRDFTGGFPELTSDDKLGILQNKNTYQFTAELNCGRNMIPPDGYEFRINKLIYDFDVDIDYALDMSGTGSFDMEKAKIMVLAIHVEGISGSLNTACEIELDIDMDYLLAVDMLPATAYDYIGIGERLDPFCPRKLPVLTALYEWIVVWENNRPPDPLIRGVDHGTDDERTAYLVAILDKNGNGQLDREDEIGYYGTDAVEIINGIPTGDLPCCFDLDIPEWFSGLLVLPTPIKRIVKGENQETREDGSLGPYWISNFIQAY